MVHAKLVCAHLKGFSGEPILEIVKIFPLVGSLTFLKYMLLYFLSPDYVQHNLSVYKMYNLSVCMDVIPASLNFLDFSDFWLSECLVHFAAYACQELPI